MVSPNLHERVLIEMISEDEAMLMRPLSFSYKGYLISLESGLISDGASIPFGAWSVIGLHPFHALVIRGAFFHDALYSSGLFTRKECDKIFKAIIRQDGLGRFRSSIVYRSVRMFGGLRYNSSTQDHSKVTISQVNENT